MSGSHPKVEIDESILTPLRAICVPYPEAVEAEAFGSPTFQVRAKNVALVHKPRQGVAVWCKAPSGAQEACLASDPRLPTAHLEPKGWAAAWLAPGAIPTGWRLGSWWTRAPVSSPEAPGEGA